jgi:hypothetical protein
MVLLVDADNLLAAIDRREADRARSRGWHHARRARGVCGNSPCEKRPELNPRTGQPYWFCRACRRAKRRS